MKRNGLTLVELLVSVALASLSILFGITLYRAQQEENRRIESLSTASSYIRQFFDLRRRLFQSGVQMSFTSFSPSKKYLNGQEVYSQLVVNANSSCGVISETIQVVCVAKNTRVPEINLKILSSPASSVFKKCVPDDCIPDGNEILGKLNKLPRIKVTREVYLKDASGKCTTNKSPNPLVTYFPQSETNLSSSGLNGNPVAATVCMQIPSGTKLADSTAIDCEIPKSSSWTAAQQALWDANCPVFRDFNLTVYMITRHGIDKFDLAQQSANFPRPKKENSSSIKSWPAGK